MELKFISALMELKFISALMELEADLNWNFSNGIPWMASMGKIFILFKNSIFNIWKKNVNENYCNKIVQSSSYYIKYYIFLYKIYILSYCIKYEMNAEKKTKTTTNGLETLRKKWRIRTNVDCFQAGKKTCSIYSKTD